MARMRWSILLVATLTVSLIPAAAPSATALSCVPPEETIVATIRIVDLDSSRDVIEVPYWTHVGCGFPVSSAPAALQDDWLVFFESESRPQGSGVLKALNLDTGERHQGVVEVEFPRLAIGDPYVYLLNGSRDGPRQLTGYPLLTDQDRGLRVLPVPPESQVHMGMHTFHQMVTPTNEAPRLTTLDLSDWRYIHKEHPLPVSESHHWRLLAGSADWSILEQHDEPVDPWQTVPDEARVWAFHHATQRLHHLQIPAGDADDYAGHQRGPKVFHIDGDRLYYTIYEHWSHTHLEALTLPDGTPAKVHDGEGLHGARVDDDRLILFVPSDDNAIPDWGAVKLQRYDGGSNWNELLEASAAYAVLGVFMGLMVVGVVRYGRR